MYQISFRGAGCKAEVGDAATREMAISKRIKDKQSILVCAGVVIVTRMTVIGFFSPALVRIHTYVGILWHYLLHKWCAVEPARLVRISSVLLTTPQLSQRTFSQKPPSRVGSSIQPTKMIGIGLIVNNENMGWAGSVTEVAPTSQR